MINLRNGQLCLVIRYFSLNGILFIITSPFHHQSFWTFLQQTINNQNQNHHHHHHHHDDHPDEQDWRCTARQFHPWHSGRFFPGPANFYLSPQHTQVLPPKKETKKKTKKGNKKRPTKKTKSDPNIGQKR